MSSPDIESRDEAKRRRALALRAHAPTWLRTLATFAFLRAVAIVAIAWFWLDHRDGASHEFGVIAWAVCSVTFELLAGITMLVTAAVRVPWGVSLALAIVAFGVLIIALIAFVGASLFERPPGWTIAVGVFDNLLRIMLITGMLWPVILARAEARDARYYGRSM